MTSHKRRAPAPPDPGFKPGGIRARAMPGVRNNSAKSAEESRTGGASFWRKKRAAKSHRQFALPLQGGGDFDATNSQAQLVLL